MIPVRRQGDGTSEKHVLRHLILDEVRAKNVLSGATGQSVRYIDLLTRNRISKQTGRQAT